LSGKAYDHEKLVGADRQNSIIFGPTAPHALGARNGGAGIDYAAEQPRAEGHDGRRAAAVKTGGMTVFARIDHAAGATAAGLSLRPTALLISAMPKPARR
jgi:hypothetical protein